MGIVNYLKSFLRQDDNIMPSIDSINFAEISNKNSTNLDTKSLTDLSKTDYINLLNELPNPDPILRDAGLRQSAYEKLVYDGHLRGVIRSRNAGTKSLQYGFVETDKYTQIITDLFKNYLDITGIIDMCLKAVQYGMSPLVPIWEKVGSYWLPTKIINRSADRFFYDAANNLYVRTIKTPSGEMLNKYQCFMASSEATFENPYGFADLSACYWYIFFKKCDYKSWHIMSEKYGIPPLIYSVPPKTPKGKKTEILEDLKSMVMDSIAVIEDMDKNAKFLETNNINSGLYEKLIQFCNQEISKIQLGHESGATNTPGKLGGEDGALAVREDIVISDSKLVEKTINNIIDIIYELNFGDIERPKWSMWKKGAVSIEQAQRDKVLSDMGVRFRKNYYINHPAYKLIDDEFDVTDIKTQQQFPSFSESDKMVSKKPVDIIMDLIEGENKTISDALLQPVIDVIKKYDNYNDILTAVLKIFPEMDETQLIKLLDRADTLSYVAGNAKEGKN